MTIVYRQKGNQVEKLLISRKVIPRGEQRPPRHNSETVLKGYYQVECEQGSRFRSNYPTSVIKRVHETALERFDQTGEA